MAERRPPPSIAPAARSSREAKKWPHVHPARASLWQQQLRLPTGCQLTASCQLLVLQLLLPTSLVRRRCGRRPIIMLLRAIPMVALLLAALLSVLAAEVPRPKKYVCERGACVENLFRGLPLSECEAVCVAPARKTIVELAAATPDLATLVLLLKAGRLVGTLSGKGPYTVFAPTNQAFAKLPAGVLLNLERPENRAQLDAVLTYHVVPGEFRAKDLKNEQVLTTLNGNYSLTVRLDGETGQVGICEKHHQGSWQTVCPKVVTPDMEASNGVVHIIDGVLLPGGPPPPAPFVGTCTKASCYFAATTPGGLGACPDYCAEVDAAPRMPASIWNDTVAVANYIKLTMEFYYLFPDTTECKKATGPRYETLVQGRCGAQNVNKKGNVDGDFRAYRVPAGNETAAWTQPELMEAICSGGDPKFGPGCGCDYPHCPDEPDEPARHHYCSLCGPKFNAPIEISRFVKRQGDAVFGGA